MRWKAPRHSPRSASRTSKASSAMDIEALADLSRAYIDTLVSTKAPSAALERAAALIIEATNELAIFVPDGPRNMYEGLTDDGDYLELFRLNPVIGRMNPVAPRFDFELRTDGP